MQMPAWLYEAGPYGLLIFLLVTVGLGGAAAYVSGRATAQTWRPFWLIPLYMLLLGCCVRFIHYAIFGEVLLSVRNYIVDCIVLMACSWAGFMFERQMQMRIQYGWRSRR